LSENNTLTDQAFTPTAAASVQFLEPIDLPPSLLLSLDAEAIQIGENSIFIDSAQFPFLDLPARITFENLGGASRILLVDFEDDGTFVPCDPPQCTLVSFTGGTLVFDVSGFTTYSSGESESPPVDSIEIVVDAVLVEIDALLVDPETSKKAKKKLKLAGKKLTKALKKLNADNIKKGLLEVSKGVKELIKAERKGVTLVIHQIELLVESSRAEAQEAVDMAEAMDGKQKFIDEAKAAMAKAQEKRVQGKPDKAIGLYRAAWDKAQKAVK